MQARIKDIRPSGLFCPDSMVSFLHALLSCPRLQVRALALQVEACRLLEAAPLPPVPPQREGVPGALGATAQTSSGGE